GAGGVGGGAERAGRRVGGAPEPQPRDGVHEVRSALRRELRANLRRRDRQPDVDALGLNRKLERIGSDADNAEWLAFEHRAAANDRWIPTESVPPQPLRDDRGWRRTASGVSGGGRGAPAQRRS